MLALIGYRGYERGRTSRDSAARFLEPQLRAWGIPYQIVERDDEVERSVPKLYRLAQGRPGPAAVLVAGAYSR